MNVAHKEIDLKNPKTNRRNAGFTDEERGKMTALLDSGFIDTFRYFYPDMTEVYSWWSYASRPEKETPDGELTTSWFRRNSKDRLEDAKIHTEVTGSDHCPVELDLK